jgi:hypothetical protein
MNPGPRSVRRIRKATERLLYEVEDLYCFGGFFGSGVRSSEAEDWDGAYAAAVVPRPCAEGPFARLLYA